MDVVHRRGRATVGEIQEELEGGGDLLGHSIGLAAAT